MSAVLYLLITWLLAAVPWGVVISLLWVGSDPRDGGSHNIGATNVLRTVGRGPAALTLTADVLKGALPVALAPLVIGAPWFAGLAALIAFAGHCWSPYLDLRGGKGVATSAGALLALAPLPTLSIVLIWGAVVASTHKSSLGALVAALCLPILLVWLSPQVLWIGAALAIGVVVRHRDNIARLVSGHEA